MTVETDLRQVLVLGLGNILFQDEGVGVRAVEQMLAEYQLPRNVRLMDGGTLGLDLLAYFSSCTHLIILDAIRSRQPPGSIIRLEDGEIPAALAQKMSMHQLGLQDLMAASRLNGTLPEKVVLFGVVPEQIDWGMALSARVAEALPRLIQATLQQLDGWGTALV